MHLHKAARFLQHLHLSSDTTAGEPRFSSSSKCLIKNKKLSLNSAASVFVKLCFCVFTKGIGTITVNGIGTLLGWLYIDQQRLCTKQ